MSVIGLALQIGHRQEVDQGVQVGSAWTFSTTWLPNARSLWERVDPGVVDHHGDAGPGVAVARIGLQLIDAGELPRLLVVVDQVAVGVDRQHVGALGQLPDGVRGGERAGDGERPEGEPAGNAEGLERLHLGRNDRPRLLVDDDDLQLLDRQGREQLLGQLAADPRIGQRGVGPHGQGGCEREHK